MEHLNRPLRHDDVPAVRVRKWVLLGDAGELLAPLGVGVALDRACFQQRVDPFQSRPRLGGQGDVRVLVLPDLGRVDVDVHDASPCGEQLQLARHAVVEADAHGEQQVGAVDGRVGRDGAVHAQHLQRERVRLRVHAQAHQRLRDRDPRPGDELAELGARVEAAPAAVEHRLPRAPQRVDHGLQRLERGRRGQPRDVPGDRHPLAPVRHRQRLLHVLGHVDEHGARAAGAREEERLLHHARQVGDVHHQVVVLGDLPRDLDDGRLLERVRANHAARDLPRDGDERHRVQERVGEARHEVGGPRARGRDADADVAGGLGVPLGREDLTLLVPAQDVAHSGRAGQRLVDLERGPPGVAERDGHALALQGLHEDVGALARRRGAEAVGPARGRVACRGGGAVSFHRCCCCFCRVADHGCRGVGASRGELFRYFVSEGFGR